IVVALLSGWLLGYPPTAHLPAYGDWSAWSREAAIGVLACAPLLAGLVLMVRFPRGPWRGLVRFVQTEVVPWFRGARAADFAVIAALAGFGEEMLFRGVLQDLMTGWWGLPAGVAVGAIIFGLAHYLTTTYAVMAGLMGLYFG